MWIFVKISEIVSNLQSWHEYMVKIAFSNIYYVQKVVTRKINQSYGSCVLHILSWCFTVVRNFKKISNTVFNLQSGHKFVVELVFNVQRAMTPKLLKLELRYMCSARRLMELLICGKVNGFQLTADLVEMVSFNIYDVQMP